MNPKAEAAVRRGEYIDITTTGRRTGLPRRIELAGHLIEGRLYISGQPSRRKRAWIRNLEADPHLTFHAKGREPADVAATARIIEDPAERRAIIERVAANWRRTDVDAMTSFSPLIEVVFDGAAPAT